MTRLLKLYGNKPENSNYPTQKAFVSNTLKRYKEQGDTRNLCFAAWALTTEADLWPPLPLSPTAEQRPLNGTSTREIHISQFHRPFEEAIKKNKVRWEKLENNWLISDFWITGEFSFCANPGQLSGLS